MTKHLSLECDNTFWMTLRSKNPSDTHFKGKIFSLPSINDHKKVMEIFRREAGLPQEEVKEEKMPQVLIKPDPLEVKEVDLKCYDTLMAW